jgi:hypothetical protein
MEAIVSGKFVIHPEIILLDCAGEIRLKSKKERSIIFFIGLFKV